MSEETRIVEQLVVLFPALAAWTIVALISVIVAGGALAARLFFKRLREQDKAAAEFRQESAIALREIKDLLASEIGKLREADYHIKERVVRIETHIGLDVGPKWSRRAGDQDGAPG